MRVLVSLHPCQHLLFSILGVLTFLMDGKCEVASYCNFTKGRFHTKMGSIKDRNGMDLTQAEDIKKRWQESRQTVQKRSQ